jgi:hypothetical protein
MCPPSSADFVMHSHLTSRQCPQAYWHCGTLTSYCSCWQCCQSGETPSFRSQPVYAMTSACGVALNFSSVVSGKGTSVTIVGTATTKRLRLAKTFCVLYCFKVLPSLSGRGQLELPCPSSASIHCIVAFVPSQKCSFGDTGKCHATRARIRSSFTREALA